MSDAAIESRELVKRTLEAIVGEYEALGVEVAGDVQASLEAIAGYMAEHWRLVAEGREAEAAENLEHLRVQARMLAARESIKAANVTERSVLRVLESLARVGAALLRGLLV